MNNQRIILIILIVLIVIALIYHFSSRQGAVMPKTATSSTSVDLSSKPISYKDLVKLANLEPNQAIKSPFVLRGEARGNWYFEGSFPFQLLDNQGNILAQGQAKAESDWATSSFVSFSATLNFKVFDDQSGKVVLIKDNPSGDPVRGDSWSIPVRFEK